MSYGFDLDKETLEAVLYLAANELVFVYQDNEGPFTKLVDNNTRGKGIKVVANLNDTFNYAADCEDIPADKIIPLAKACYAFEPYSKNWMVICLWAKKHRSQEFIEKVKRDIDATLTSDQQLTYFDI